MKLNRMERWVVNNPLRAMEQRLQMGWLKGLATIPDDSRILEVGCGRGAGAHLIAKQFQPAQLHALDLDLQMVRKASRIPPQLIMRRRSCSPWRTQSIFPVKVAPSMPRLALGCCIMCRTGAQPWLKSFVS